MINTITTAIMSLNVAALLAMGYMMFWPVQLSEIYNEPFPVYPQEVSRGDTLAFTVHFEKSQHYQVESNRVIICDDGNLVTLATLPTKSSVPLGEHEATVQITIPEKISNGKCHIELSNTYTINPLRTEHREMMTQDFYVYE